MKAIRAFCSVILALGLLWLVGLVWFISEIPRDPVEDERFTDAIVVLTGGSLRIEGGMRLIAAGRAKKMFISGVGRGVNMPALLKEAERTSGILPETLAASVIVLGHNAFDTKTNAQETADWLRSEDYHSIRLVTANYHLPRSILEFRRLLPDVEIIADPVFPGEFKYEAWWKFEGPTRLVLSEYHKYMASELHYMLVNTGAIKNTL